MLQPLIVWITTNCGIFLKRLKYQATLPVSCEICMQDKNDQLELDLEQLTGSVLRKEHIKAVFCHLAHITYMQSSVQFSVSVVSDYLRPHESQHARLPCPSPTPGVHSNSGLSSRWCHPDISSSFIPFSSCPQSLPASESFPMSQLFAWGGQSTGVSALASFLPKNTQD